MLKQSELDKWIDKTTYEFWDRDSEGNENCAGNDSNGREQAALHIIEIAEQWCEERQGVMVDIWELIDYLKEYAGVVENA